MAISTPIGQIRYNPNTLFQEIWDGKTWVEVDDTGFTQMPIHTISANTISTTAASNIVNANLTDNAKEDLYQFLKSNLRVGEYLDENGKIEYVQLELREGEGCTWETIQRVRIKQ